MDNSRRGYFLKIDIEASATLHEGALACHQAGLPPVLGPFSAVFYIGQDAADAAARLTVALLPES